MRLREICHSIFSYLKLIRRWKLVNVSCLHHAVINMNVTVETASVIIGTGTSTLEIVLGRRWHMNIFMRTFLLICSLVIWYKYHLFKSKVSQIFLTMRPLFWDCSSVHLTSWVATVVGTHSRSSLMNPILQAQSLKMSNFLTHKISNLWLVTCTVIPKVYGKC